MLPTHRTFSVPGAGRTGGASGGSGGGSGSGSGGRPGANDAAQRAQFTLALRRAGVMDTRVLSALESVPRPAFVPEALRSHAYADCALAIGLGQTISAPSVVGKMTQVLAVQPNDNVLEVGTGCGYQAAVLASLARRVTSVERHGALADSARQRLSELGYLNVSVLHGDGFCGAPQAAPFDAIMVTAAAPHVPKALVEQLADGGRLMIPVQRRGQAGEVRAELVLLRRQGQELRQETVDQASFVPMLTGLT